MCCILHSNSVQGRCISVSTYLYTSAIVSLDRSSFKLLQATPGGVFTAKNISTNHNNNLEYYYDYRCTNRWWCRSGILLWSSSSADVFPGCCEYYVYAVSLIKNITGYNMHLFVFIRPRGTVPVHVLPLHQQTLIPGLYYVLRIAYRVILWPAVNCWK